MQTSMTRKSINDELMTGAETFPIMGDLIDQQTVSHILSQFAGLSRHWHCLEKAQITQAMLGQGIVVVGSCYIWSADGKSNYGYNFTPPYEFHSWLQFTNGIIDLSLPGAIEKGLTTSDEIGPFLTGREPIILAGIPPKWINYTPVEIIGR